MEKQIKILFNPMRTTICTTSQIAYKVTGIPDTYLVFGEEVEKYFSPKTKPRRKRQAHSKEDNHVSSLAWGHITPLLSYLPTTDFEASLGNNKYVITISNVLKPLHLQAPYGTFKKATWEQYGIPIGTQQQFDLSSDQSISFTYEEALPIICIRGYGGTCVFPGFLKDTGYCLEKRQKLRDRRSIIISKCQRESLQCTKRRTSEKKKSNSHQE